MAKKKMLSWSPEFGRLILSYAGAFLFVLLVGDGLSRGNGRVGMFAANVSAAAFYSFLLLPLVYAVMLLCPVRERSSSSLREPLSKGAGRGKPSIFVGMAAGLLLAFWALESHPLAAYRGGVFFSFGDNLYLLALFLVQPLVQAMPGLIFVGVILFWLVTGAAAAFLLARSTGSRMILGLLGGLLLGVFSCLSALLAREEGGAASFLFGEALYDMAVFPQRWLPGYPGMEIEGVLVFFGGLGLFSGWLLSRPYAGRAFLFLSLAAAFFPGAVLLRHYQGELKVPAPLQAHSYPGGLMDSAWKLSKPASFGMLELPGWQNLFKEGGLSRSVPGSPIPGFLARGSGSFRMIQLLSHQEKNRPSFVTPA